MNEIISSVIGGMIVGAINLLFFHKQKVLEKKLDRLENDRLQKVEAKLDEHLANDVSKACVVQFKAINDSMTNIQKKLDKLLASDATQTADIQHLKEGLAELKYDFRNKKSSK